MGKILIINGANFSQVAVGVVTPEGFAPTITISDAGNVTITDARAIAIFYTTDGTTPTTSSTQYSSSFTVTFGTTIKAVSVYASGGMSTVVSLTYGMVYYDFISFDGNSYVATEVTVKANTRVESAGAITGWASTHHYAHLLGSRTANTDSLDKFTIQIANNTDGGSSSQCVTAAIGDRTYFATGINADFNVKYTIVADADSLTINGNTFSVGASIVPGTYPFFLGNTNSGGSPLTAGQAFVGNIYETKFYEDSTLVADLKPVINSDNQVGFYDTISGSFYGNSGTGTLTAGND